MSYLKPEISASWLVADIYATASGFASGAGGIGGNSCDGGIDAPGGQLGFCLGIDSVL